MRVATALLVAVLVWPGVHHVLARTLSLDPWAFFGFAMYAVPNLRVSVRAARLDPALAGAAPDWNAIPPSSWSLLRAFGERRSRYGVLLSPDALARELFAVQPELPGLLVRVRRFEIGRESSRIEAIDQDYLYAPPGVRLSGH
jgi:hypothetical protein